MDSHVFPFLLVCFTLFSLSPSSLVNSCTFATLIVTSPHNGSLSPSANRTCQFLAHQLSLYSNSKFLVERTRMAQTTLGLVPQVVFLIVQSALGIGSQVSIRQAERTTSVEKEKVSGTLSRVSHHIFLHVNLDTPD